MLTEIACKAAACAADKARARYTAAGGLYLEVSAAANGAGLLNSCLTQYGAAYPLARGAGREHRAPRAAPPAGGVYVQCTRSWSSVPPHPLFASLLYGVAV